MATETLTKEQQAQRVTELAIKHGLRLGRQPLVADLMLVLEKLDSVQTSLAALLEALKDEPNP
jgi:hypothetical protein